MSLTKHPNFWPLLLLGLTVVALVMLAAGFDTFELQPGQPFPYALLFGNDSATTAGGGMPLPLPGAFLEMVTVIGIILLGLILLLWIITFIIRPQARKRMLRRIITYFIMLLLLSMMLSFVRQWRPRPITEPGQGQAEALIEPTPPPEVMPTPPPFVVDPPPWLATVIVFTFTLLLFGGLWWLWQHRQPPPRPSIQQEADRLAPLLEEVQQTLTDMQAGHQVKNRVLGCYRAMVEMMQAERHIERTQTMTARDFEQYLLASGFTDDHISRLTRLFEQFRYGATEPDAAAETEAIDCLSAIVEAYGGTR